MLWAVKKNEERSNSFETERLLWRLFMGCEDVKQKSNFFAYPTSVLRVERHHPTNFKLRTKMQIVKFNSNYIRKPPTEHVCSFFAYNHRAMWAKYRAHSRMELNERQLQQQQTSKAVKRKMAIKYSPLFMNCTLQSSNYSFFFAYFMCLLFSETCLMTIKKA